MIISATLYYLYLSTFADVLMAKGLVCYNCNHPITGKHLKIDHRLFHPECFVCKNCRNIITGQYKKEGNAYLHADCYLKVKKLYCTYCGKPLGTKYIIFDKKKYHPQCAKNQIVQKRPICSICGKSIINEYALDKNGKYHPECFKAHKLPRCCICAAPIEGKFIKDPWGNISHKKHDRQPVPFCSSCNRIISGPSSKGGYTYSDGRTVCGYCKTTAIEYKKDIGQSFNKVLKQLSAIGITPIPSRIPVHLVDKPFMKKQRNSANPKGLTRSESTYMKGRRISQKQTIYILYGLPKTEFEAVLAHELFHVWLNQNNISMSDRNTEGFCNLGAMLIYQADNTPFSHIILDKMEKDPDSEYGKGYRVMKKKLHKLGWHRLILNIKAGK